MPKNFLYKDSLMREIQKQLLCCFKRENVHLSRNRCSNGERKKCRAQGFYFGPEIGKWYWVIEQFTEAETKLRSEEKNSGKCGPVDMKNTWLNQLWGSQSCFPAWFMFWLQSPEAGCYFHLSAFSCPFQQGLCFSHSWFTVCFFWFD